MMLTGIIGRRCQGRVASLVGPRDREQASSSASGGGTSDFKDGYNNDSEGISKASPTAATGTTTTAAAARGLSVTSTPVSSQGLMALSTLITNAVQAAMTANTPAIDARIQAGIKSHLVPPATLATLVPPPPTSAGAAATSLHPLPPPTWAAWYAT